MFLDACTARQKRCKSRLSSRRVTCLLSLLRCPVAVIRPSGVPDGHVGSCARQLSHTTACLLGLMAWSPESERLLRGVTLAQAAWQMRGGGPCCLLSQLLAAVSSSAGRQDSEGGATTTAAVLRPLLLIIAAGGSRKGHSSPIGWQSSP